MRVVARTEKCVGAGQCVLVAPEIFDQDDGGTVVVMVQEPPVGQHESAREAAYLCPSSTIEIVDDVAPTR